LTTWTPEIPPEEVVLALLHVAGNQVRIRDNRELNKILDRAADEHPDLFGPFHSHPQYGTSLTLHDVLLKLKLGGSIIYEGLSEYFRASNYVADEYGKVFVDKLTLAQQAAVKETATRVQQTFHL
jgi:hypothetical protein